MNDIEEELLKKISKFSKSDQKDITSLLLAIKRYIDIKIEIIKEDLKKDEKSS